MQVSEWKTKKSCKMTYNVFTATLNVKVDVDVNLYIMHHRSGTSNALNVISKQVRETLM